MAIRGVTGAQWKWKPAPAEWSVGEAAEHVALAEALLFGFVRKALAAPPNRAWEEQTKGKTELLIRALPSGEGQRNFMTGRRDHLRRRDRGSGSPCIGPGMPSSPRLSTREGAHTGSRGEGFRMGPP